MHSALNRFMSSDRGIVFQNHINDANIDRQRFYVQVEELNLSEYRRSFTHDGYVLTDQRRWTNFRRS